MVTRHQARLITLEYVGEGTIDETLMLVGKVTSRNAFGINTKHLKSRQPARWSCQWIADKQICPVDFRSRTAQNCEHLLSYPCQKSHKEQLLL